MKKKLYSVDGIAKKTEIVVGRNLAEQFLSETGKQVRSIVLIGEGLFSSNKEQFNKFVSEKKWIDFKIIDDSEINKTFRNYQALLKLLHLSQIDRRSSVIYFGGGTVSDLVGFACSTYKRGVAFTGFPTTLLAMVDASIGGKNGIDLYGVKNLVGTFQLPERIICDLDYLNSGRDLQKQGLGEIVKYGLLFDSSILDNLRNYRSFGELIGDQDFENLVLKCIDLKMNVVKSDFDETSGIRQILNFGHTIGHLIEAASGYKLPHGQAILRGMIIESDILKNLGLDGYEVSGDIHDIIARYGISIPILDKVFIHRIAAHLKNDKKINGGMIRMQLIKSPGRSENVDVSVESVVGMLKKWR